jgi:YD repeat-containing protein
MAWRIILFWLAGALLASADLPVSPGASVKVQQTAVTDFRGKTIVTTEDVMNRLATKVLPAVNVADVDPTVTYSYTPGGQLSQVQTSTNGAAMRTVYYAYDALNRLVQKDAPEGVLAYTWTPDNHVQTIQGYRRSAVTVNGPIPTNAVPDVNVAYSYDYAGRLASAECATNSPPDPTEYYYDAVGNLGFVWNREYDENYLYDAENRLTEMGVGFGEGGSDYTYGLDATGQRTNVSESMQCHTSGNAVQTWRTVNYEYDRNYSSGAAPAREPPIMATTRSGPPTRCRCWGV